MKAPVMRRVTQPPSGNLNQTVRQSTEDVSRNPVPFIARPESPFLLRRAVLPPVQDHPELGEGEGEEHVDGIHDDEVLDRPAGDVEHQERHAAHEHHAVFPDQAFGEVGEAAGGVVIQRHVGEDLRAVDDAGLGRDEQERRLRPEHDRQEDLAAVPLPEVPDDLAEEDGVQRLPRDVPDFVQQVAQKDPAREERQGDRHVEPSPSSPSGRAAPAASASSWRPPRYR